MRGTSFWALRVSPFLSVPPQGGPPYLPLTRRNRRKRIMCVCVCLCLNRAGPTIWSWWRCLYLPPQRQRYSRKLFSKILGLNKALGTIFFSLAYAISIAPFGGPGNKDPFRCILDWPGILYDSSSVFFLKYYNDWTRKLSLSRIFYNWNIKTLSSDADSR